MPWTERSLAGRVGWTAACAALAASVATLLVAMVIVDRGVSDKAEADLRERAEAFLHELEADAQGSRQLSPKDIEAEVREFSHGGVAVAVYGRDGRVGGSAAVPMVSREGCEVRRGEGGGWMVCRVSTADGHYFGLLGEPRSQLLAHRKQLVIGGIAALCVLGVLGVLAGLFVGKWSLRPLARLRESLDQGDLISGNETRSLPRSGLIEVDDLAATLDDLLERLSRELQRSRRFAADAAHELRAPLAKIRAELELMLDDPSLAGPQEATIERAISRADDLTRLVERLLVLASPEDSLRGSTLVSMSALVESVLDDTSEADRVERSLEGDGIVVGDATVLASVVSNAIGNALKFSEESVQVTVADDDHEVVFRVDDKGPGLSESDRARAFEPFFRAPAHRATRGHGIGLALIAHVANAHGGTAQFEEGGPGAHLVIRLPGHPLAQGAN